MRERPGEPMDSEVLLEAKHLFTSYGDVDIVRDVSFTLRKGEALGIVGESGCGKTTLLRSLMVLKKGRHDFIKGRIMFEGEELTGLSPSALRNLRGGKIAMIPQNASAAMDGTKTISSLFLETIRVHGERVSRKESDRRATELMKALWLEDTDRILRSYPFELSGGMCQRVMIAAAMINGPRLLLADEPTSALDAASQLQVIQELRMLKEQFGVSLVMISHNLGAVSAVSDTIAVMYGGRVVEYGKKEEILNHPAHPYTKALMEAVPDLSGNISAGLGGLPPAFTADRKGCPFASRCSLCGRRCLEELPEDFVLEGEHRVQCHGAEERKIWSF